MSEKLKSPVLKLPVGERDHSQGSADAPVTLVEYGDFECSLCGKAFPVLKELLSTYEGKIRFIFRNFPMKTLHPNAYDAALAAEAAGLQGKFWEIHSIFFKNQDNLEKPQLFRYAASTGADAERLKADMESEAVRAKVKEDFRSGVISGVNGTPTFFINDIRYNGTYYLWDISKAVDRALAQPVQGS
jgi:protein-disulfide isomerase